MTKEALVPRNVTELVPICSIYLDETDSELEIKINQSVARILLEDDRFKDPDIETVDALRDWVRAEAVLKKVCDEIMKGGSTASMERMYRFAMSQKNVHRDEIFSKFRGKSAKGDELDFATMILVDDGIIEPQTEVDILEE